MTRHRKGDEDGPNRDSVLQEDSGPLLHRLRQVLQGHGGEGDYDSLKPMLEQKFGVEVILGTQPY